MGVTIELKEAIDNEEVDLCENGDTGVQAFLIPTKIKDEKIARKLLEEFRLIMNDAIYGKELK